MTNVSDQQEIDRLLQTEWREKEIPNLSAGQWIRVYQCSNSDKYAWLDISSTIIPNNYVHNVFDSHSWDTSVDRFAPSYERLLGKGSNETIFKYYRFSNSVGIEPLVIQRSFHGLKPKTIEILEEFRLFHNLYFEPTNTTFVRFDDSGDEVEVVRIHDNFVDVKRKEIRQFLTARNMSLAVYFDRKIFSHLTIGNIDERQAESARHGEEYTYRFALMEWDSLSGEDLRSYSRLLGKKIIKGLPLEKSGLWPFDEELEKEFEEFEIGIDDNDEPIYYTSNPDKLADCFGKNSDAPNFLTPVFFRREVLAKYYNQQTKYKVEDGTLWCGSKWMLRMDNNHVDYVIVFLGDLGGDLPHKEQTYWKSYNIEPDGYMSGTYFRQSICAEFTNPEDSALLFQGAYRILAKSWHKEFSWYLFKPLEEPDIHHFKTLRRPLNNEYAELNEIAVSLSKLLPEAINSDELLSIIKSAHPNSKHNSPKKKIPVLREYLVLRKYDDSKYDVDYLEKVQLLRSAVASHRTDNMPEAYKQVRDFFGLDTKSTVQVADEIFTTLTDFLNSLRAHFCPDETD